MAAPVASTPVWASGTSLALSALSAVGGAAIAVGWLLSAQRSHLRQKLILGLGLTDFTQGVTTLIGSALQLSGNPYRTNSPACNGSGFIYQACVIANACWTLVIAATTYITLVHPFSKCTAKLDSPYAFGATAAVVLVLALVPSIAITAEYDMVNQGGLCWLKTGTRSAQLTLFVPRATALVVVISLYTRLFIFFRRRDVGLLDSSSDRRDGDANEDDDVDALEGRKRLSVASLSARLAAWNRRRSSDTVYTPAPQHTRSMALEAIPASPIQFTQSFPSRSRDPPPPHDPDLLAADPAPRPFPTTTTPPLSSSFADPVELRGERKPSTVSFGGLDPHSSDESTAADGGPGSRSGDSPPSGGAPAPPSSTRSKRLSSAGSSAFPAKLSRGGGGGIDSRRGTGMGSQPHQHSGTGGGGGRRMSLSPRQINKRLSMLMAVFPLAYCALVAVAVARLIQELSTSKRPSTALSWASRFLINSIGAIDGILFVFVQQAFKWWIKRDSRP
ncbi:hypothetical protein JCM8208_002256 [Rhodotorula glutinis]